MIRKKKGGGYEGWVEFVSWYPFIVLRWKSCNNSTQ